MKTIELVTILVMVIPVLILFYKGYKKPSTKENMMTAVVGGPFDIQKFNDLFVKANQVLADGDLKSLKSGIALLMESMDFAGDVYTKDLVPAIEYLRCALTRYERADTKGPWNRDLSGYGVLSWKNDLYDRDTALRAAWPHIKKINDDLKKQWLGWDF